MSGVFLGTDRFAAGVLTDLSAAGHLPDLVISRPDAPRGRGRRVEAPEVAAEAIRLGIELMQPQSLDDPGVIEAIEEIDPDVLVLCAYGAIVREPLLSRRPILNLHPSLLPRWRGAAPIERALMAGDAETGVSIIRLVEELDAGPVWRAEAVPIEGDDDYESLSRKLRAVGSRLLCEALELSREEGLEFVEQVPDGVTYAERIEAGDRFLDPERGAVELERQVRALRPHIGARLELGSGEVIGVRAADVVASELEAGKISFREGAILLGASPGTLAVTRLIPPGGREMTTSDWLRGRPDHG